MIKITTKDIVFCVDILKTPLLNQFMEKNKCSESIYNCSYWIKYLEKIPVSNPCIDSCFNTSYIYEYSGKCYAKCSFENFFNNYICYDCIELGKCHELTANEFKNQIKDKITLYANSSKVIDGLNFLATISSSDEINPEEQLKNGISAFDLGNCTNVLKEYYDIPDEENLIILNMEIINKNESSNKNDKSFILEKNTQIEIYDNSGRKLNLSICKQDIKILKYIGEVKTVDIYSAQSLSNKGIDIFDPDDKFFNDICHNYDNLDGKDMIIKDRRNDYFKNVSFCQYGCKYKGMNYSLMIANCVCDLTFIQEDFDNINLKNTESISFTDIKNTFLSNLLSFNLDVLRCFNLVFDKKTITKN